tara:strand:+ start:188 stop:718 length:531 start_codon:yes stop_codon:yes gene_type:complete
MALNWNKLFRKVHYWGAFLIFLPALVIITTGIILHLKKNIDWIQPPIRESYINNHPKISFDDILSTAKKAEKANIKQWDDIDRLDVRPNKGIVKVKAKNHWEIQIDTYTGNIVQVAYRRSDIIENIHDGSWFHENIKYWVFFPTGIFLLILWITGIYMVFLPYIVQSRKKRLKKHI